MKKRVLITGARGMLGVDLSQELKNDFEVIGTDLVNSSQLTLRAYRPEGPEAVDGYFKCDITDKEAVRRLVAKIRPDVVIHAAAWTDVDGCELEPKKACRVNSEGTKNVAEACKGSGAVLIYISTDFVFDGKKKRPYKESDKPHPVSVYGDSKLKGEEAVRKTLKKYFILRTSWLYGKHGKNFVDTILAKAKEGKALKVVDDQVGSPTYTKDLAKAICVLLRKVFTQYGTYHVSNSGSVSWYEYTKEILRLARRRNAVTPVSSEDLDRPARRPAMSELDNTKFEKLTGFKMRQWKNALGEYLKRG